MQLEDKQEPGLVRASCWPWKDRQIVFQADFKGEGGENKKDEGAEVHPPHRLSELNKHGFYPRTAQPRPDLRGLTRKPEKTSF